MLLYVLVKQLTSWYIYMHAWMHACDILAYKRLTYSPTNRLIFKLFYITPPFLSMFRRSSPSTRSLAGSSTAVSPWWIRVWTKTRRRYCSGRMNWGGWRCMGILLLCLIWSRYSDGWYTYIHMLVCDASYQDIACVLYSICIVFVVINEIFWMW